ncbi:MAG TPA: excinuclease ABC subunit UvrB [Anaerolineales bacterium]|nr:excinuclease ABC subunit UvrB [Anaerolineales bacterium]
MTQLFDLHAPYQPTGDQPQAIEKLVAGLNKSYKHQILLGATGTGKTFTMAQVIQQSQRPALILAHNKTLAAQLYAEFKEFFPKNAVEYFVSYYDYYQPESYVPRNDLYIEKETDINEEIEKLRLAATTSLFSRKDVIIVASVSCIYGLGSPVAYGNRILHLEVGQSYRRTNLLRQLVEIQFGRNDTALENGTFSVKGDTLEIMPAHADVVYRLGFFGDELERILEIEHVSGEVLAIYDKLDIFPAKHFVTEEEKLKAAIQDIEQEMLERVQYFKEREMYIEMQRIEQRTRYDLEMLRAVGYCSGIENYSRPLDQRPAGSHPWSLLDFFPPEFLLIIDESHIAVPQVRGMYGGDQSRKQTLVDYGFRLPSAMDNRPLSFDEFEKYMGQVIYTTATPGPYEKERAQQVVEQIIRPTGLVDPQIELHPVEGQIDHLLEQVKQRISRGERVLVTTLTKRMSEDLSKYMKEIGIKVTYLHSEVQTVERIEILRDLRLGVYDVLVGINLLREGLDLPEVSLVAILDADKEGFLRSVTSLIQIVGRAARHINGHVIMYANKMTDSMKAAITETNRRREIQLAHNQAHGIIPASIVKSIRDLTQRVAVLREEPGTYNTGDPTPARAFNPADLPRRELSKLIQEIESEMKAAAKQLEFEKAAALRDQLLELRQVLVDKEPDLPEWKRAERLAQAGSEKSPYQA